MTHYSLAVVEIALVMIAADLASGVVHWMQDRLQFSRNSPLSRFVILYAREHHLLPDKLRDYSWLERNGYPTCVGVVVVSCWTTGVLPWQLALFMLLLIFSGEVHYWAHRTPEENGLMIYTFQMVGLLQDADHHKQHHRESNKNLCVITSFVNPILNCTRIFTLLDKWRGNA